ncbi:MAG: LamG domain-containing protein [Candidatus Paceibacterota bacterium]
MKTVFGRFSRVQKRIIVFVILPFLLTGTIFTLAELGTPGENGSTAAANTLDYGLVGYWDMEEGGGQTVYDKSGNGNDGTLGSSSSVDSSDPVFGSGHDSSGENGTGMVFDGVDDYVDCGDDESLNFGTGDFSVELWFKSSTGGSGTNRFIVTKYGTGYTQSYMFYQDTGDQFVFRIIDLNVGIKVISYDDYNDGIWHNAIGIRNGDNLYLYVDGILVDSNTGAATYNISNDRKLRIGARDIDSSLLPFNGSIDDVRIYNRALSEDEIRQLYNQKKPVLEMNFDEGSGTVAHDESFNNYDGAIYGANGTAESGDSTTLTDIEKTWTTDEWKGEAIEITAGTGLGQTRTIASNTASAITVSSVWVTTPDATSVYSITSDSEWGAGKNGTGMVFDGVDDYVDMGDVLDMGKSDWSASLWFKTTDDFGSLISKSFPDYLIGRWFTVIEGGNFISGFSGTDHHTVALTPCDPYLDDNWHHILTTYDRDGNITQYLDGISKGTADISAFVDVDMQTETSLFLGSYNDGVTGTLPLADILPFAGSIDSVRIYNYARTADEVLTDYNDGKAAHLGENNQDLNAGLVGYWNMEEGSGQTVYDKSGNNNNGTLGASSSAGSDDPTFGPGHDSSGPTGTAAVFDGVNDFMDAGDVLDMRTNDMTVSAWVKTDVANQSQSLVSKSKAAAQDYRYDVAVINGKIRIFMHGDGVEDIIVVGNINVADDEWHFISALYDRDGNASIYVDGIYDTSLSISQWVGVDMNSNNPFRIGTYTAADNVTPVYLFDGSIDEVRIYNRALSEDEIRQLYNQKKPVLEMNFDEGSGTVAHDESFNDNDGIISGATWTTGVNGRGALAFDGVDDYVNAGNDESLNITDNITIEVWFKSNDNSFNNALVGALSSWQTPYSLFIRKDTQISFNFNYLGTRHYYIFSVPSLGTTEWHHAVVTYSNPNAFLYLDGKKYTASPIDSSVTRAYAGINIGQIGGLDMEYFQGSIDNVRIYNYARTADEVLTDYNDGKAAHLGKNNQDLNDGLVGYWNMEEGSGQTVYDVSGNNNNGTLGSSSSVDSSDPAFGSGHDSSGENGTGMVFDGVDDYVNCGNDESLDITDAITVSVWVKRNEEVFGSYDGIVARSGRQYALKGVLGTKKVSFFVRDDATYSASSQTSDLEPNAWYHVVGVYEDSTDIFNIYVNGILDVEDTTGRSMHSSPSEFLYIGRELGDYSFNGSIDDVRIYNRALSEDEIRQLYNQKKPVLEMNFDEGSGTVAHDESFNNNDGTLGGGTTTYMPTWTTGKSGSALQFDGVDDYVDAGNVLNMAVNDSFTIGAWVKTSSVAPGGIVSKFPINGNNPGYYTSVNGSGVPMGWIGDSSDTPTPNWVFSSVVNDNDWHYVVWIRNRSQQKLLGYVDGELDGSANDTTVSGLENTGSLLIGNRSVTVPVYFNGTIDSVRIYNYARSASEVLTDYNNGLAAHLR